MKVNKKTDVKTYKTQSDNSLDTTNRYKSNEFNTAE